MLLLTRLLLDSADGVAATTAGNRHAAIQENGVGFAFTPGDQDS
jgi:hypothetical protein